jgi:acetyl esterase
MPQRGATVLYIHGGGFLLGGLDSHADVCVGLCQGTGLDVIAIAYRLAPENLHPSQLDDVEAAYAFLVDHGARVILAGDSAGANLAAALCLRLRRKQLPQPCGQVLIYPGLGGDMSQGSYVSNRHAPMLSTEESKYYFDIRTGGQTDRDSSQDAELLPLRALDFSGLAPAYVVTADIDPLRDDGADYVERLQAAGVAAQLRNEPQLVHGYLRARHISQRAAASFSSICAAIARMADGTFQTA